MWKKWMEKIMMDYILHLDILRQLYRCCWTCVGKVDVWECFLKTFLLTTQEKIITNEVKVEIFFSIRNV